MHYCTNLDVSQSNRKFQNKFTLFLGHIGTQIMRFVLLTRKKPFPSHQHALKHQDGYLFSLLSM